ncbi:A/G-specific adenine glycosylase [Singulisphaera sp. Ch08]|uniref:Adenine DNA glycosylase n=1 Tax=Singulisphaera sp. Ch08 TaxID=3120278 RepID=A0AAU7CAR9_9BACT
MGRPRKSKIEKDDPLAAEPSPGPDLDPNWGSRVRERLVAWYEHAKRPLPWRTDQTPYRILVSEMMLVQTTVTAVVPYFERFLNQFPTIQALAVADEAEVLKAWEGLGYYRRARQLHAAARAVVTEHGGTFPTTPDTIRALPGVGRYIAGAILSFAFDQPAPIVEANTQRVLSRWLAWREDLKSSRSQARLWEAAERLVPSQGAGVFNQAFMELGALLCTPRSPSCLVCPVAAECGARILGIQDLVPTTTPKSPPLEVAEACGLVVRDGRVLIVQRGPGRLWEHFWEFPTIHLNGVDPAGRSFADPVDLAEGIRRFTGARVRVGPVVQTVRYSVTKHRVKLDAYAATGLSEELNPGPGLVRAVWEVPEKLAAYTFGAASRRLVSWMAKHEADFHDFQSDR